jgi:hypothetical protein
VARRGTTTSSRCTGRSTTRATACTAR